MAIVQLRAGSFSLEEPFVIRGYRPYPSLQADYFRMARYTTATTGSKHDAHISGSTNTSAGRHMRLGAIS
jgi:hypothetical protein